MLYVGIMNYKKDINSLVIASLIHDIGKVIQRSNYFDKEKHDELSNVFFNVITKNVLKNLDTNLIDVDFIEYIVANHHVKIEELDLDVDEKHRNFIKIIKRADSLIAKQERKSEIKDLSKKPEEVNIQSIFSRLNNLTDNFLFKISSTYDFEKEVFFPIKDELLNVNNNRSGYGQIIKKWRNFLSCYHKTKLNLFDFVLFLEEFGNLYLTRIPEDRREIEYVYSSLNEHLKFTALYSSIIYHSPNEHKFFYLKFDFSGIQKFIFNVKNKKAAQILRGRSVFLQFLADIVSLIIVKELDLYSICIVSNYGGNVQLFLPIISPDFKNQIESLINKISVSLLKNFHINLRYILTEGSLDKIDSLYLEKSNQLIPKYSQDLIFNLKEINQFEDDFNSYSDKENCFYCENGQGKYQLKNENGLICEICNLSLSLSDVLVKDKVFRLVKVKNFSKNIGARIFQDYYLDLDNQIDGEFQISFQSLKRFLDKKNSKDSEETILKTLFYEVRLPKDEKKVKTFSELSEGSFLALAKGDLDNMSLFIRKISEIQKEKDFFFGAYFNFARNVNLFFQNYLPEKIKEDLYLVYSGGDDFVLLGQWEKVFKFLINFYKDDFNSFFCQSDISTNERKFSFSVGMELFKENFPILTVIEKAEEKLTKAKSYDFKKGKMTFLHSTLNFEDWQKIYNLAKKIDSQREKISTSFYYKIYSLADYLLDEKTNYHQSLSLYKMQYFYIRNFSSEDYNNTEFKNFFDRLLTKKEKSEEIDFYKKNLKSIINLILLKRREEVKE